MHPHVNPYSVPLVYPWYTFLLCQKLLAPGKISDLCNKKIRCKKAHSTFWTFAGG
jgi:hypothetical protein